jgi:hypothetical protein
MISKAGRLRYKTVNRAPCFTRPTTSGNRLRNSFTLIRVLIVDFLGSS